MQSSEEDVRRYQEIYFKEYGREIPFDEAYESASSLLNLMKNFLLRELDFNGTDIERPSRHHGGKRDA